MSLSQRSAYQSLNILGFELALLISGHDLMSICSAFQSHSDHELVLRKSDHDSINICTTSLTSDTLGFCPQLKPSGLRSSAQEPVLHISMSLASQTNIP